MNDRLVDIGWQNHLEEQVSVSEKSDCLIARVAAHFGRNLLLLTSDGESQVPAPLLEPPEQIQSNGFSSIAVGDWFLLDPDSKRAIRQLERSTLISRKGAGELLRPQLIAANVDTVFIVSSCNQDFNLSRLERYLALVFQSQAQAVIVLTKRDLHDDPYSLRRQAENLSRDLLVELVDARCSNEVSVLETWCSTGKTIALLGSSGVGKSTLANTLCGSQILTQNVRTDDDKGRHTTTARALHKLHWGGWLIDSPGMRELQIADCQDGIRDVFDDVLEIAGQCRFRDCNHQGDQGCALAAAIAAGTLEHRRVASFLKLRSEQQRNTESLADRRVKDRKMGKMYKRVIADKKKLKDLR